jgi:hypothetical protein
MKHRQVKRRQAFQVALATMPMWETWTDERVDGNGETRTVNHCKGIPRSVRRSMARDLARRKLANEAAGLLKK